MIALNGGDDVVQIHVQAELEDVAHLGIEGFIRNINVLRMSMKVLGFVYHNREWACLPTLANPSWHLTAAPLSGLARLPVRAAGSSGCGSALIR